MQFMYRHFFQHAAYTPPSFSPAELFGVGDRGFFFDFAPASMRKAGGAQAAVGDQVTAIIPAAGTSTNATLSASTPVAGAGYIDFAAASGERPTFSVEFLPLTKGGFTVFALCTEPDLSGAANRMTTIDAQSGSNALLRGPSFLAGAAESYSFESTTVNCTTGYTYTRTIGARSLHMQRVDATTISMYRDSATASASAASNNRMRDLASAPFALGATYLGTTTLQQFYDRRMYAAFAIDRALTAAEIAQVVAWAAAVPL